MRQSRLLGFWALSALVALTVSCGPEVLPPTEVLVTVDSDLEIGRLLSSLRVTVQSADGASTSVASVPFVLASAGSEHEGRYTLPLTFRIPKREADAFEIVVQGYGPVGPGSTEIEVVVQRALLRFQAGTTLKTTLFLGSACFRQLCDEVAGALVCYPFADQATAAGQCGPVREVGSEPLDPQSTPRQIVPLTPDLPAGEPASKPAGEPQTETALDASTSTHPTPAQEPPPSTPASVGPTSPSTTAPTAPLGEPPSGFSTLSAGSGGTCAIRADQTLACWGAYGRNRSSVTPVPIAGLASVVEIAIGDFGHSCAVTAAGTVMCWGNNSYGAIGNGKKNGLLEITVPTPVESLTGVIHVSVNDSSSCALKLDGTVACWGDNTDGQLGVGTRTIALRPMPVPGLSEVVQLALHGDEHCALKKGGTVACWGSEVQTVPTPAPVVALAARSGTVCALLFDRSVMCWGSNDEGQLGDGTRLSSSKPVPVQRLSGVLGLGGGNGHMCAIRSDRRLVCWGDNRSGQLGNTAVQQSSTPLLVEGVTDVAEVTGDSTHTCARQRSGQVLCWGSSEDGLGFATQDAISPPRPVVGL